MFSDGSPREKPLWVMGIGNGASPAGSGRTGRVRLASPRCMSSVTTSGDGQTSGQRLSEIARRIREPGLKRWAITFRGELDLLDLPRM